MQFFRIVGCTDLLNGITHTQQDGLSNAFADPFKEINVHFAAGFLISLDLRGQVKFPVRLRAGMSWGSLSVWITNRPLCWLVVGFHIQVQIDQAL